ncbi:cellulase family glycosylhydrolase [Actinomycetes bacterium M1A6_2h]
MKQLLKRTLLTLAALVLMTTVLPAGSASAASPLNGKQAIGLNGISFRDSSAVQQASAAKIAGAGATWARIEADWWYIQDGGKTSFNWGGLDSAIAAARARSLNVLVLIQKTPAWARTTSNGSTPPTNPADFAAFAGQVVARYSPSGVANFEVWNEPNISRFWADPSTGKPNAVAYTNLLKAAYPAMKAASKIPINVITAGLSPWGSTGASADGSSISPLTYLQEMYKAGAKSYFDHVGWHPYTAPRLPDYQNTANAWLQMGQDFRNSDGTIAQKSARTIMSDNGDAGKLIIMTEAGAPTAGALSMSENDQATSYQQSITARAADSWAGPIFFYTLSDTAATEVANPNRENYFGIYRQNGSAKPVVSVLQNVK